MEIVGYASGGYQALELIQTLHPDLVLMDWAMPELNGLETTRRMKLQSNAPSIILLTQYNFDEYRNAAMTARADGCIAKSEFGMQLVPLVHLLFPELDVPTDRGPGLTDTPVTARPN